MKYLLDTNACIAFLRDPANSKIAVQIASHQPGEIVIGVMVRAELLYGAERSSRRERALQQLAKFFQDFLSLPFDDVAASAYAVIRADLEAKGTPIGPNDLVIAAIAIAHGLTLITHNTREFSRVPGLVVEDWQT